MVSGYHSTFQKTDDMCECEIYVAMSILHERKAVHYVHRLFLCEIASVRVNHN